MAEKTVPPSVQSLLASTYDSSVLSRVGDYAGVVRLGKRKIVVSTDGVGTKVRVACEEPPDAWPDPEWPHRCIGQDLVNHCVNDILTAGATPLCFANAFSYSDDRALEFLRPFVEGMAAAAKVVDLPLVTGETAKMEGFYPNGAYDVVGTVVGFLNDGAGFGGPVTPGCQLIGLPSSGPHTNGYTLIRKVFADPQFSHLWAGEGLRTSVRVACMQPHRCYYSAFRDATDSGLLAMAHVTGGGIDANLPRVLGGLGHRVDWPRACWPPLFRIIQECGGLSDAAMREAFNLGVGVIMVFPPLGQSNAFAELKLAGHDPIYLGETF